MLLVIDIGNTNVSCGVFDGKRMVRRRVFRVADCGSAARVSAAVRRFTPYEIEGVCICSVVPRLNKFFRPACRKVFGLRPLFAVPGNIGIAIHKYNSRQVGHDRLVAALAAHSKYHRAAIVIDAGSAITVDFVTKDGEFAGGVIAPGMGLSARALGEMTAKLPLVKKIKPGRIIGRCTREAIESGIYYGTAGLVDAIVRRIVRETGTRPAVVATGGSAGAIAKISKTIGRVEPDLLFHGLRLVWEQNKKPMEITGSL